LPFSNHTADRTARRAERREELLDAAVSAIRRDGAAVSMETIAAEAGITKPIVYKHFGDRDGLIRALAERFAGGLLNELDAKLGRDLEPEELLRGTIDAYLAFVEREPSLYRFLIARMGDPLGYAPDRIGLVSHISERVASVVSQKMRAEGVDPTAAEPWAFGIVGMVHLAGDWWLDRRSMSRDQLVGYLSDLLWKGILGVTATADAPR